MPPTEVVTVANYATDSGLTWAYNGQAIIPDYFDGAGGYVETVPEYVLTGLEYDPGEDLGVGSTAKIDEYGREWLLVDDDTVLTAARCVAPLGEQAYGAASFRACSGGNYLDEPTCRIATSVQLKCGTWTGFRDCDVGLIHFPAGFGECSYVGLGVIEVLATSGAGMSGGPLYRCPRGDCEVDALITGLLGGFTGYGQNGAHAGSFWSWVIANM